MKMILVCSLLICLGISGQTIFSQELSSHVKPLLLDKSSLSGQGLKQVKLPNEPERDFFQKVVYRGKELNVFLVSSQSWKGQMENFFIDEYVYIFNGKSRAKPVSGKDLYFQSGEHFIIPKGYTGEWEVMAGDNYHYELSVFASKRVPEANISAKFQPHLFDKDKLSGLAIELDQKGRYKEVLYQGDELKISLEAEKPRKIEIEKTSHETLIRVLSGEIELTDAIGESYTFYTDDFVLLPIGFSGYWESKGHGLLKYLTIERAR